MELHGREGRRGTDRRSVGLKKSERRRARTRVRIDRRLIYGGQWIGPLFTPVVATSPVRFFLFLVPTTIPCYDSLSPIVTFHGAYGKPLDRGRDCPQLLSICASTRWFRLRSLPIFFRVEKEKTIIVPSLSPLLSTLSSSVPFPFEKAKEYRYKSNRFVVRSYWSWQ